MGWLPIGAAAQPPIDGREQARRRRRRGRPAARRAGTWGASASARRSGHALGACPRRRGRSRRPAAGQQPVQLSLQPGLVPARLPEHPAVLRRDDEDGVEPIGSFGCGPCERAGQRPGQRLRRRGTSGRTTAAGPSPAKSVTVDGARREAPLHRQRLPRRARLVLGEAERVLAGVAEGRPGRSRPGRPPPTLRTTSCSARPIVALARLPCPSTLTPVFMPMRAAIGPVHDHHRPGEVGRAQQAVDVELVGAGRLDRGQHDREVLGLAAGHHGVDRRPSRRCTSTRSGGTTATTSSGARRRALAASAAPGPRWAATTGSPSVQPRSNIASDSSSRRASSTRRRRSAARRAGRELSGDRGSTVSEPQPGRYRAGPRPGRRRR